MMKLLYTIIIMALVLFVITFSLNNTDPVILGYYGLFKIEVDSYLLIFISFGAGIIIAGFFGFAERWRLSRKAAQQDRQIRKLKEKAAGTDNSIDVPELQSRDYQG